MAEFLYETGAGHSDCPECGTYVSEVNEDYVTSSGEVRRKTIWDCPRCGAVEKDELYLIEDDDDRRFIWGAFLKAKEMGVVPPDIQEPLNPGM